MQWLQSKYYVIIEIFRLDFKNLFIRFNLFDFFELFINLIILNDEFKST